jgi:hypothetical protein
VGQADRAIRLWQLSVAQGHRCWPADATISGASLHRIEPDPEVEGVHRLEDRVRAAIGVAVRLGGLADFVTMQVAGIAFFILGANLSGQAAGRLGVERTIAGETALSAAGMLAILVYGLGGGAEPRTLAVLAVPVNLGFGLRRPAGFMRAVVASRGDDALVVLAILLTAAGGTALAAPFVTEGLPPLATIPVAISCGAVLCLALLPPLADGPATPATEGGLT